MDGRRQKDVFKKEVLQPSWEMQKPKKGAHIDA